MSFMLQVVKVFSEDGTCKMVEILADMTARDFCQLLIYKSHCVDDNSWTLVEHHPHLGLGREWSRKMRAYTIALSFCIIHIRPMSCFFSLVLLFNNPVPHD